MIMFVLMLEPNSLVATAAMVYVPPCTADTVPVKVPSGCIVAGKPVSSIMGN